MRLRRRHQSVWPMHDGHWFIVTMFKIQGHRQVIANLSTLENRVRKKILRKVVRKAQKPMIADARQRCPKKTGQLRKSLGTIVKTYGSNVIAVGGPRGGFRIEIDGQAVDPVHYAHLVEMGHRGGGFSKVAVPPHPFLGPAFEANKEKAQRMAMEEIAIEIEKEAARKANS